MWRRFYLLLLGVRLYFALAPSYIHPDEHFQGPEVMAGHIFGWPTIKTWEFTADAPIRSFFPLWLVFGIPMKMLDWIVPGSEPPAPMAMFYFLRIVFFLLSFVLEDSAIQELLPTPRRRRIALSLVASSYVTWTYQTHTFSNSIETLAVLWSLVLLQRIATSPTTPYLSAFLLGFVTISGTFNRITFPAFLILPGAYQLLPRVLKDPLTLLPLFFSAALTTALAIHTDTTQYTPGASIFASPILTPLNNILYNSSTANLALHGLHPRYTHLLVNLPQLLGPALLLLRGSVRSTPVLSALGGIAILSLLPHQEARFLLPCVPLLLTAVQLPSSKAWIAAWLLFNSFYGVFLGVFHQAGIVPAQAFLAGTSATTVVYWKTYNPPTWLLGARSGEVETVVLMGAPVERLVGVLKNVAGCGESAYLAVPLSAVALDAVLDDVELPFVLERVWSTRRHVNMDDLEFGDDGVVETVKRVVGRRGLGVWRVKKRVCVE